MGNCNARPDAAMMVAGGGHATAWRPKARVDAALCSTVELHISASNLPKLDLTSQSDPFAVVYVPREQLKYVHDAQRRATTSTGTAARERDHQWVEAFRTEKIKNSADPHFAASLVLDFHFEDEQRILVELYDSDRAGSQDLQDHDYVGSAKLTLGEIVGNRHGYSSRPLVDTIGRPVAGQRHGAGHAMLTISGEEQAECADVLMMRLSARGLKNLDGMFDKSDPYVDFCRYRDVEGASAGVGGFNVAQAAPTWTRVFHTEVVMDNLNPRFRPLEIPIQTLCNGDHRRPLRLACWDWDPDGNHDLLGTVECSLHELLRGGSAPTRLQLKDARGKRAGELVVEGASIVRRPTFLDFIHAGLTMPLTCAIDFTGSNLHGGRNGLSLHAALPPPRKNDYQHAIHAVAPVLAAYDASDAIDTYGFGAILAHMGTQVDHCFALADVAQPGHSMDHGAAIGGVNGVLEAYSAAISHNNGSRLRMYGPTIFSEFLQTVRVKVSHDVEVARGSTGADFVRRLRYNIVLILTDGRITDLQDTKDEIVQLAKLPVSIVIVGVGSADFSSMEELDADQHPLENRMGEIAARDIVQFVPYRDFHHLAGAEALLAHETLAELPGQVLEYMQLARATLEPHVAFPGSAGGSGSGPGSGLAVPATASSVPLPAPPPSYEAQTAPGAPPVMAPRQPPQAFSNQLQPLQQVAAYQPPIGVPMAAPLGPAAQATKGRAAFSAAMQ